MSLQRCPTIDVHPSVRSAYQAHHLNLTISGRDRSPEPLHQPSPGGETKHASPFFSSSTPAEVSDAIPKAAQTFSKQFSHLASPCMSEHPQPGTFTANPSMLSSCISTIASSIMSACNQQAGNPQCTAGGPPHGVKAVCGKRPKMEDTYAVQTNFYDLHTHSLDTVEEDTLPVRIATRIQAGLCWCTTHCEMDVAASSPTGAAAATLGCPTSPTSGSASSSIDSTESDTLHFFAVYDGHGGFEAASHCQQRLHHHLSQAIQASAGNQAGGLLLQEPAAVMQCSESAPAVCAGGWATTPGTPPSAAASAPPAAFSPQTQQFLIHTAAAPLGSAHPHTQPYRPGQVDSTAGQAARLLAPSSNPPQGQLAAAAAPRLGMTKAYSGGSDACPDDKVASQGCYLQDKPPPGADSFGMHEQELLPEALQQQQILISSPAPIPLEPKEVQRPVAMDLGGMDSDLWSLPPAPGNDSFNHGSRNSNITSFSTAFVEEALREAFLKTDAEFAEDGAAAMVGSTAVVALLGKRRIWVANCGDSRAVLCRAGRAVQLTDDHKPDREDEAERVVKAGGQVLYWNGHRVMGILAMSRAIGDHGLRPYVISDPEITALTRSPGDDFLLLASDGLWDVMGNQDATNLAMRCLTRAWEKGAGRKAAARIAANVLTKAAMDKGSKDNVTVLLIDLRAEPAPGSVMATVTEQHSATAAAAACTAAVSEAAASSVPCPIGGAAL